MAVCLQNALVASLKPLKFIRTGILTNIQYLILILFVCNHCYIYVLLHFVLMFRSQKARIPYNVFFLGSRVNLYTLPPRITLATIFHVAYQNLVLF